MTAPQLLAWIKCAKLKRQKSAHGWLLGILREHFKWRDKFKRILNFFGRATILPEIRSDNPFPLRNVITELVSPLEDTSGTLELLLQLDTQEINLRMEKENFLFTANDISSTFLSPDSAICAK